jgi:hypothetical protein
MDILVPADAEQYVFDLITSHGHTVGATPQGDSAGAMRLPFVSYEITGGSRRNMVTDAVLVMVRCYASKRADASDLCREVYGILMAEQYRPDGKVRKSTSVGHPVFYPDGQSKTYRYQASVQLQLRPEIL